MTKTHLIKLVAIVILCFTSFGQATELIVNGGFESGLSNWTSFWGTGIQAMLTTYPHTGSHYAYLTGNNSSGGIYQNVTIPANASSATLSFWWNVSSEETSSTTIYDDFYVVLYDSSGINQLALVKTLSNLNKGTAGAYQQVIYDLMAYRGQTISLRMNGQNDATLNTTFRIDDVSVIATIAAVPASPTNLQVIGNTSKVLLTWNDNSTNEDGFKIERKVGTSGSWAYYTSTGANQNAYQDNSVSNGTVYYYRIYAYNSAGNSPYYTNEANGMPLDVPSLSSPDNGATVNGSSVNLQWNSVLGANSYGVDMGTSSGATDILNNAAATTNNYTKTGLSAGTYYWRVRAGNTVNLGVSDPSGGRSFTISTGQPNWVFLYYFCNGAGGGSDLETGCVSKFTSIAQAAGNQNVDIYLLWDHSGSTNEDRVFHVKNNTDWNNGYTHNVDYWTATDIGLPYAEMDTGDVTTLNKFVDFALSKTQAQHYALVILNHGGGISPTVVSMSTETQPVITGIAWDDQSGNYLSIKELSQSCSHFASAIGKKIDVLQLDACLMQMTEINYEIRNSVIYNVATENEGFATTWEKDYLNQITGATDSLALASSMAEKYFAVTKYWGATISVVQSENAQTLSTTVDSLGTALRNNLSSIRGAIDSAREATQKFAYDDWHNTQTSSNYFLDLREFAQEIKQRVSIPEVVTACDAVISAVGDPGGSFVKLEHHQSGAGYFQGDPQPYDYDFSRGCYGISIFFPKTATLATYQNYTNQSSTPANLAFCVDTSWDEFLKDYLEPQPAGTLQFKSATYSLAENGGSVHISVSRTGGSSGAASVNYATADGTATAGSDYTEKSGTLSWTDGDSGDKSFDVPITDDALYEGNETFTASLSGANGASLGSPSSTVVTITDNDSPPTNYTITASAGSNGSISPSGSIQKNAGESQQFLATPNTNYAVDTWHLNGQAVQTGGTTYTLSNIQSNCTVNVTFKYVPPVYTITASAGSNGSISPSGSIQKNAGESQQFIASPNTNYAVDAWYLDSQSVQTGGTTYTLNNIQSNHSVNVTFKYVPPTLVRIEISGSTQVSESSGAQYTCTAYYDDGSTLNVTNSASWSENSPYASISSSTGYLTTSPVSSDQPCTITATYNGYPDTYDITIKEVPSLCKFGSFDGQKNKPLTLKDCSNNDVTFSLTGGGYGEIDCYDCTFSNITLYDTAEKTVLSIKTRGNVGTCVGDIICNGPMKGINAKTIDISGSIEIGSSANPKASVKIVFDEASNLTIDSEIPIKSLTITEWVGGAINAPSVSCLTIKGDKKRGISGDLVDVDLNLSRKPDTKIMALGKLTVKGWIDSSQILSQGNIGTVTTGGMFNSCCFAGVEEGVMGLPDPETEINYDEPATIRKITIKGIKGEPSPYYINSNIAAAQILSVYLAYPDYDNGGTVFGIAADYIKVLRIKDADGAHSWKKLDKPTDAPDLPGNAEILLHEP